MMCTVLVSRVKEGHLIFFGYPARMDRHVVCSDGSAFMLCWIRKLRSDLKDYGIVLLWFSWNVEGMMVSDVWREKRMEGFNLFFAFMCVR